MSRGRFAGAAAPLAGGTIMASKKADVGMALPSTAASADGNPTWLQRHGWKLSGGVAMLTFGGLLWRRRRRLRAADLEPVTSQWLADREYEDGQRGVDD